jgi:hypothetical protein
MDFDDQLLRHFGTTDLGSLTPGVLEGGRKRLAVDFRLEQDRATRFAMWAVMHILGNAPDLDIAFDNRDDRDAAREFMDLLARFWDS